MFLNCHRKNKAFILLLIKFLIKITGEQPGTLSLFNIVKSSLNFLKLFNTAQRPATNRPSRCTKTLFDSTPLKYSKTDYIHKHYDTIDHYVGIGI